MKIKKKIHTEVSEEDDGFVFPDPPSDWGL